MTKIQNLPDSGIIFVPAVVCYLLKGDKVILGLRKRVSLGLGENLISGIGGKIGDHEECVGESPEEALEREVFEEIGVRITGFKRMGRVRFIFPHKPKWNQDVVVYVVDSWEGDPIETEEIKPIEFDAANLPVTRMWDDNKYWVPLVLSGQYIEAAFLFDENSKVIGKVIKS